MKISKIFLSFSLVLILVGCRLFDFGRVDRISTHQSQSSSNPSLPHSTIASVETKTPVQSTQTHSINLYDQWAAIAFSDFFSNIYVIDNPFFGEIDNKEIMFTLTDRDIVEWIEDSNRINITIPLLPHGSMMDNKFFYKEYKGDLLIGYEYNTGGAGSTYLLRISKNRNTPVWATDLHTFNLSSPTVYNDKCYVSSVTNKGFIGKIDLNTGEFDWRQDGIVVDSRTMDLQPFVTDAQLVFFVIGVPFAPEDHTYLLVNDNTGQIIDTVHVKQ